MGGIASLLRRGEDGDDDIELGADPAGVRAANPYRYPPKAGELYFGNSFWIGSRKFDMDATDGFLFGENSDVNFLSGRPRQFPFHVPHVGQPTQVLQALVNIQKDSLKLIRSGEPGSKHYHVEFMYDSDVPVEVTIHLNAVESLRDQVLSYSSDSSTRTELLEAGYNRTYRTPGTVNPSDIPPRLLTVPSDGPMGSLPMVIFCDVLEMGLGNQSSHGHILIANFEKSGDDVFTAKTIKQKQLIDGTVLLLQEIYGLDGNAKPATAVNSGELDNDDDDADSDDDLDADSQNGMECELCLSEPRDTMILPCRHLTICSSCAEQLRFTASNCPFCRQPFSALLHIRAFQEVMSQPQSPAINGGSGVQCVSVAASSPTDTEIALSAEAAREQSSEVPGHREVALADAFGIAPLPINCIRNSSSSPMSTSADRVPTDSGVPASLGGEGDADLSLSVAIRSGSRSLGASSSTHSTSTSDSLSATVTATSSTSAAHTDTNTDTATADADVEVEVGASADSDTDATATVTAMPSSSDGHGVSDDTPAVATADHATPRSYEESESVHSTGISTLD